MSAHLLACIPIGLAVLTGCASPLRANDPVRPGVWGGTGASLEVTGEGGRIEFDCARGTLDAPLETDRAGEFQATGTYTAERPGPQREDERAEPQRARYAGRVSDSARTMTLHIAIVETGERLGPFTLTFGTTGRLRKCL